ncbi:MAG: DUF4412 domain-containing protein [Flavobacteriales bacterium]|nr:DUF4412 domain-containing protein [Flavobacteriales bacterium]MBK7241689.1 DUF4412 domain-containing protein [Flavobacteriales bacterium]MBK9534872.1 DUF4412 domain-containing protein [Flavobacteriales bacterium]MBP9137654.1 DUF4412 domain-containing protein [Flavobacteriales bacterium]HQX30503.1 DUF4412 domain-containing protein [Flavobacteriales bacterium]
MRTLILSTLLISTITVAQTDAEKALIEQYTGAGMPVVEKDDSPFVPNTFIGDFIMDITTMDKKTEKPQTMSIHYASNAEMTSIRMDAAEMKGQEMTMMTDLKNKWQYMMMTDNNGKKTAMKTPKMKINIKETPDAEKDGSETDVTVTNETKTINGHVCSKVIAKSKEGTWTGWMAKGVAVPFTDLTNNIASGNVSALKYDDRQITGFPMEFEMVDAETNEKTQGVTREFNLGEPPASTFSLDGYQVVELPMALPGMMGR